MSDRHPSPPTRSRRRALQSGLVAAPLLAAGCLPAMAHHPIGGGRVTTFGQGLLSGLGHPVIGLDHLVFLLAIGAIAALVAGGARAIAAFMIASMAGVVAHLARVGLPFVEPAIAVTVLAAGLLLITGRLRTPPAVLALVVAGGALHGYALAESIVGVESTPLAADLVGLVAVQGVPRLVALNQLWYSPPNAMAC